MREAIGGTWLFGLVITFIVFFASFLAVSINYSKAFNVKNNIVDIISNIIRFKIGIEVVFKKLDNKTYDADWEYDDNDVNDFKLVCYESIDNQIGTVCN